MKNSRLQKQKTLQIRIDQPTHYTVLKAQEKFNATQAAILRDALNQWLEKNGPYK